MNWNLWLRGLMAAFVGGGAGGATAGLTAIGLDPEHFNLTAGLPKVLAAGGISFLVNGILSVLGYLKQSPLPAGREAAGLSHAL